MKQPWESQINEGPSLTREELEGLDWVLCYPLQTPPFDLDWHMRWTDMRLAIWAGLAAMDRTVKAKDPVTRVQIPMTESEAKILLALVPTTGKWGTGADWAYSLKMQLAKFVLREDEDGYKDIAESDTKDTSTGEPSESAMDQPTADMPIAD